MTMQPGDEERAIREAERHLHAEWQNNAPTIPLNGGGRRGRNRNSRDMAWFPYVTATIMFFPGAVGGVILDIAFLKGWELGHFGLWGTLLIDGGVTSGATFYGARKLTNYVNRL